MQFIKNLKFKIIILIILGLGIFFSLKSTPPVSPEIQKETAALEENVSANRYENEKYGFSFEKPEGYTVGATRDDFGEVLVVQNMKTNSGFQIYITPADSDTKITKSQIEADLPGTKVLNSKTVNLDGASGLSFDSNNSAFGDKSFEVWFTYKNYLYQVSSYQSFSPELQKIIATWKFGR